MFSAATIIAASRATARVLARRPLRGPARPSWSLEYEVVVEIAKMALGDEVNWPARRARLDQTARERPGSSEFDTEPVSRPIRGQWVMPRAGYGETVIFYLHGGGYCIGSPTSHEGFVAHLAKKCHATALMVDYRLAPEHPCPAALDDALAAYRFLRGRDVSAEHIVIAGDSAGGGLALSVLMALRDAGESLPAAAVLLSPWGDLSADAEHFDNRIDYLNPAMLAEFGSAYLGEGDENDVRASPLRGDFSGLPPTCVIIGGQETLREQGRALVSKASQSGVEVRAIEHEDEIHCYPLFYPLSPGAGDAIRQIVAFVAEQAPESVSEVSEMSEVSEVSEVPERSESSDE